MKTELKIGLALLLVVVVVKFLKRDPAAKNVPDMVEHGALVVDVRSPGEFSGGHIEGAINIPHDVIANRIQSVEKDKSRSIIVYCHSGTRSGMAKHSLHSAGYTNVVNGGSYHAMRSRLSH